MSPKFVPLLALTSRTPISRAFPVVLCCVLVPHCTRAIRTCSYGYRVRYLDLVILQALRNPTDTALSVMFVGLFVLAALLGRGVVAQRPSNASLCDYYAINLYGANTTDTQFQLIQSILALAFAGAGGTGLSNVSSDLTGIFNPGTVVDPSGVKIGVDLQPWFNGSIDSTNLNNQPVAINWFDAGGKAPLTAFLSKQTANIVMPNSTNE